MTIATRRALRLLTLLAIGVVALNAATSSALAAAKVKVFFARDDRLQTVQRVVPDGGDRLQVAVAALFRGPTAVERKAGIRSAIPRRVVVQEIVVANSVAFLRLPETFAVGGSGDIVDLRLAQLAHTVIY